MSPSRIIQVSQFVRRRVQCKKNIFIFIFIFLTLHIFYFYFFSEPITISSSFYAPIEFASPPYYIAAFGLGVISILLGILGYFCTGVLYLACRKRRNDSRLIKTVEEGTRPEINISDVELFPRPIIVNHLKTIFQPAKDQSRYYTVCGGHGTGKTTLIRLASREVGRGVVYVDVPPFVNDFGEAFGEAINFAFEEDISFNNQLRRKLGSTDNNPKWVRALKAFQHAAKAYKVKYDRPMVIVYDNVSRLDPEVIRILQNSAKDNADSQTYIAVFVSSEGSVPKIMEKNSSYSRASNRPIEIGDLTKEESIEYLVDKRKIKEEAANSLYELVGGRIVDLKFVADDFLSGQAFKGIKQAILSITEKKLKSAQIYPKQKYHKVACQIINSLLTIKELEYRKYLQFFDNVEEADEVLEKNVFAYHPGKNVVTFQSQSVELYIRTEADDFGVKLIDLNSADEDNATTSNQMDTIIQEEYPPITEEPSHQHPSNLNSSREN
ncbi:P-loop containing nucleoside triphosphate hydrolase protein [Glomus cerebriforme]|uniref:P-loop containing nucleoside triphosphate hydrolase protein n=1 Tax=Glomus cerebriforme TaxID=658196 RepID=A0A397TAH5_9GLOM|nr:P-loop containing nucleoside triphosphate hydrolase protein [Glomus cerebriforme]